MPTRCARSCLFTRLGVTPVNRVGARRQAQHKKLHYPIVCARNYVFFPPPFWSRCRSRINRISFRTFEFSVETIFQPNCYPPRRPSIIFFHFLPAGCSSVLSASVNKTTEVNQFFYFVRDEMIKLVVRISESFCAEATLCVRWNGVRSQCRAN